MSLFSPFFPGGKRKVFTLSYDDGVPQDIRLVELINRYGLKATFHINAGLTHQEGRLSLDQLATLYQGHEIAAHSLRHPTLSQLPIDQLGWEIIEDRRQLESITGYPVRGFSYPNGAFTDRLSAMLPAYGIDYARTTISREDFGLPENFHQWHPTCRHREEVMEKAAAFDKLNPTNLRLFYVWGHSYELDQNVPNNNWELIESLFAFMQQRQESVWFATNIEIHDYLQALKRLRTSVDGRILHNQSHLEIWGRVNSTLITLAPGQQLSL